VLNVTKPGFALHSQVLNTLAVGIPVPLNPVQIATVNGGTGGVIGIGAGNGSAGGNGNCGDCDCRCGLRRAGDHCDNDRDRVLVDTDNTRVIVERLRHHENEMGCGKVDPAAAGNLGVTFTAGSFVTASGASYTGQVSVEGFQYDFQNKPIPGNYGGVYGGKPVRIASFGAFHLLPRDAAGNPLKMAPGKSAQVSVPIQTAQLTIAPATMPFFYYDEGSGLWQEEGTLTRNGDRYVGQIQHFSVFNADTTFTDGACVKVDLDSSFTLPVTLDAFYFDNGTNTFHHNGTSALQPVIGTERITPNQSFTLTITDSNPSHAPVSVALFFGPSLPSADWYQGQPGIDVDQVNFSHCNGPVQVYNQVIPSVEPYFLGQVFGPPSITDNSAAYQSATQAGPAQPRNTLNGWKTLNGFNTNGVIVPGSGEASGIYFNNGDLKFGRDMHCRQNVATKAMACYVSNFGVVGTDDATLVVPQAEAYEAGGQGFTNPAVTLPGATVAMEYDPVKGVQFLPTKTL
jgi:hypothetical protein